MTLGQEHFGGHAHQLAIGAQLLRIAGQAEHADQPVIEHQRQVDPGLHALQALGGVHVELDDPAVGQHQLGTFVASVDALRLAAAEDQALAVHHVDVARQDGHRPVDDILRQVVVQFEHEQVLRVGRRHSRLWLGLCKSTRQWRYTPRDSSGRAPKQATR
jgi:hypothetical protein